MSHVTKLYFFAAEIRDRGNTNNPGTALILSMYVSCRLRPNGHGKLYIQLVRIPKISLSCGEGLVCFAFKSFSLRIMPKRTLQITVDFSRIIDDL